MDKDILKMFKEHNHDGIESTKLNASNIEINSHFLKNIKDTKINEAIRTIDFVLGNKQDILKGKEGNIVSYSKDGVIELDKDFYSKNDHEHSNYAKITNMKDGNLPSFENGKFKDSNISANEIVKKNELEQSNKLVDSLINKLNEQLKHTHNEYVQKIKGNDSIVIINEEGNVIPTNIKIEDIILKKDSEKIIIENIENNLESFKKKLNERSLINHTHNEFNSFIKKDEFKDLLKKALKEIVEGK